MEIIKPPTGSGGSGDWDEISRTARGQLIIEYRTLQFESTKYLNDIPVYMEKFREIDQIRRQIKAVLINEEQTFSNQITAENSQDQSRKIAQALKFSVGINNSLLWGDLSKFKDENPEHYQPGRVAYTVIKPNIEGKLEYADCPSPD